MSGNSDSKIIDSANPPPPLNKTPETRSSSMSSTEPKEHDNNASPNETSATATVKSGTNTPQWGEPVSVARPLDTTNPDFPALQRALSLARNSSDGEDDESFNLDKTLKNVSEQKRQLGHKEKKLDVAWKDLYVRGVGASALYGQTLGRFVRIAF